MGLTQGGPVIEITSLQNPKVKQVVRLRDRRQRDNKSDRFLIEGYRELLRAVDAGYPIESLFICPALFLGTNESTLIDRCGAKTYSCPEHVFRKMSYRDRPDGLLAIAPQMHRSLQELTLFQKSQLYLIAESIEKPGNLGAILRSSDATGVDALIVCDRCTDIHNPNVVRASVGTLFTVPVIEAEGKETLNWLKKNKISILAATPHGKKNYTEVDMRGSLAIVVGTEQLGLTDLWMEQGDFASPNPDVGHCRFSQCRNGDHTLTL